MHRVDTSIGNYDQMYRKRSNLHQGKRNIWFPRAGECGLGHHWRCVDLEVISVMAELL